MIILVISSYESHAIKPLVPDLQTSKDYFQDYLVAGWQLAHTAK